MEVGILELINKVKEYNACEEEKVMKAYEMAKTLHEGQYRQSGEEYITHPVNVAFILALMKADADTLCAGLLHDTLEDTNITKEEIAHYFNPSVAALVDGVTKMNKLDFSTKSDMNDANTRKIITGITEDVRIIIIKLADRLHNMRTLGFKNDFKQKENSIETMEIFVPLAYYIGAYEIKSELEDISLKYLKPDMYKKISDKRDIISLESDPCLDEMIYKIGRILDDKDISNEIKKRIKNIYGIYKKINEGHKLSDIHDLLALKIMVKEVDDCYRALGLVHREYHPINDKFKDYICNPKTNMYRSLHSTVFGEDGKLVQAQIRTNEMEKIASYGLTTYWDINKGQAREVMQSDLKKRYQFFKSLTEINAMFGDNQEFLDQVKKEIFASNVYVYTSSGEIMELPIGSTPIDFAYRIHTDVGNTLVAAIVNDEYVPLDYKLKSKDRIRVITDTLSFGPREDWIGKAQTSYARKKIRDLN